MGPGLPQAFAGVTSSINQIYSLFHSGLFVEPDRCEVLIDEMG